MMSYLSHAFRIKASHGIIVMLGFQSVAALSLPSVPSNVDHHDLYRGIHQAAAAA